MNWRTWAVIAFAALTIVYRGVDRTQNSAGRILDLGYELRQAAGGVRLARSAAASLSPSPAGQRLRDGDLVHAVTVRGLTTEVRTRTALGDALRPLSDGETWTAHVTREGAGAVDVELPAVRPPWPLSWVEAAIPLGFTAVTVVAALLLAWLRPGDHVPYLGAMLFLCLGYVIGTPLQGLPTPARQLAAVLQAVSSAFLPYLFLRFFALFPSPGWLARRLPWLFAPLLVVTAIGAVLLSGVLLREVDTVPAAWQLPYAPVWNASWLLLYIAMIAGGTASLVAQYRYADSPTARRRLGIVVAGLAIGIGPLMAYAAAAGIAGDTSSPAWLWMAVAVVLCLPLFPASFAYAVVRHRVLGVDAILRRGAKYLLVSRSLLVLESVLLLGALFAITRGIASTPLSDWHPVIVPLAGAVVTAVGLFGLARLNRAVQPAIDRRFFRDDYESARVLAEVSADLKRLAPDPTAVLAHAAGVLARTLRTSAHGALAFDEAGRDGSPFAVADVGAGEAPALRPSQLDDAVARLGVDWAFRRWLDASPPGIPAIVDATDPVPWRPSEGRNDDWQPSVVVPIQAGDRLVAALLLGEKLSEEPLSRRDKALISAAAAQVAIALEYGRLIRQAAEQESFRRDMDVAQQVQAHLFPRRPPEVAGLDFAGACRPARTIGGDYYDAIGLRDGRLAVAVGDVVGKGVGAALLMANLQATLRTLLAHTDRLDEVVAGLNRLVTASTEPGKFITLFVGAADPVAATLTYVNAGHNPPVLRRADGTLETLAPTGVAVALMPRASFAIASTPFRRGDCLIVFTDGVTEAMDPDGNFYGDERLAGLLRRFADGDAAAMRDRLLADVEAFTGDVAPGDDVTVAVVRNVGAGVPSDAPRS